ncbi:hypothetical protein [Burkholderia sp. SR8]|uniref:hypothetical protein n=1 Tax=Burkholderia sp. SR8 TaxID=3062277 RepID=UPI00406490E1
MKEAAEAIGGTEGDTGAAARVASPAFVEMAATVGSDGSTDARRSADGAMCSVVAEAEAEAGSSFAPTAPASGVPRTAAASRAPLAARRLPPDDARRPFGVAPGVRAASARLSRVSAPSASLSDFTGRSPATAPTAPATAVALSAANPSCVTAPSTVSDTLPAFAFALSMSGSPIAIAPTLAGCCASAAFIAAASNARTTSASVTSSCPGIDPDSADTATSSSCSRAATGAPNPSSVACRPASSLSAVAATACTSASVSSRATPGARAAGSNTGSPNRSSVRSSRSASPAGAWAGRADALAAVSAAAAAERGRERSERERGRETDSVMESDYRPANAEPDVERNR